MRVALWGRSRVRRSECASRGGVHCRGAGGDGAHAILSGEEVFQKGILRQTLVYPQDMPERGSGAGWDIRHLFSPPSRAAEGREDPRTEPHAPAHGAPGNPTPITLMDMSDQEGVGSASDPEATLTHPSARDNVGT